jgi:hypothetical protein
VDHAGEWVVAGLLAIQTVHAKLNGRETLVRTSAALRGLAEYGADGLNNAPETRDDLLEGLRLRLHGIKHPRLHLLLLGRVALTSCQGSRQLRMEPVTGRPASTARIHTLQTIRRASEQ